jgi:hypothetical protein
MNLSIVLATVVAGALIAIARLYHFSSSASSYIAAALLTLSFAALGFTAYSILRALCGYEYARVPMPSALRQWRNDLVNWHTSHGAIDQVDTDFEEGFLTKLGEAVENNAANNKRRSARIYQANMATGIAAALLVPPSVLFVVQDNLSEPQPHAVEIVGGKIQIIGDEENGE